MTKSQRKVLRSTGLMGVLLTLVVLVLDQIGALTPLERLLYDMRAKYCQIWLLVPADRIVHFDIDDAALASLGRWPWPRTLLAQLTDELRRAGPRIIAFDIVFPESEEPATTAAFDEAIEPSKADLAFADAIRSSGRAILPVSFTFESTQTPDPVRDAIAHELNGDLELRPEDLPQRLARRGLTHVAPEKLTHEFLRAREEVMLDRLLDPALKGRGLQAARTKLLPHSEPLSSSPTLRLLRKCYEQAQAIASLDVKTRAMSPRLPSLLHCTDAQCPIAAFGDAAQYIGFVDYLPVDDGVVRRVPLWVEYRGRLVPQFGFLLACAMLDVDVRDERQVELWPDRVIIRPPGAAPIVLPVGTYPAAAYGLVGMQLDIPWAGRKGWKSLYGLDADGSPRRHLSLNVVADACNRRRAIQTNNHNADDAIRFLLGHINENERLAQYNAHLPPVDDVGARDAVIQFVMKEVTGSGEIESYRSLTSDQLNKLSADDRDTVTRTLSSYDALAQVRQQNRSLGSELEGLTQLLRREVAGKAVMIGSTASSATDTVPASIDARCPGPVAHSTIFNGIMTRRLFWEAPPWATILIALGMGVLTTAAVVFMSPWLAVATSGALGAAYLALNGILLYDRQHMIFGLAGPVAAAAVVWSGCTLFRYILDRGEKVRITRRFRSYVDPVLVNYVIENPDKVRLAGEKKEVSIVFTDLRDFTRLTERLGEGVVGVLSEYMGEMVPVIRECRGYVNKFLGDGIMCLFGAPVWHPDHAGDAIAAVMKMNRALACFNERLKVRDLPPLTMRAGINTAHVIVGDAGADATDYTAVGDGVNVAFRLESANKVLGTNTLIGARTAELVDGRYLLRPVGRLHVVGKSEPLMTYEPLAIAQDATDPQRRVVEETEKVVRLYQSGKFGECLAAIAAAQQRLGCSGRLLELYRELCERYKSHTPIDFRGQITLEEK